MSDSYPDEVIGVFAANRSENTQSVELWARGHFDAVMGGGSTEVEVANASAYVENRSTEQIVSQMAAKMASSGIIFGLAVVTLRYKHFSPERYFVAGADGFAEITPAEYKQMMSVYFV